MKFIQSGLCVTAIVALSGCASTTPTVETRSSYSVFDIQAGSDISAARISQAVKEAVQKNMSKANIVYGIPPSPLPEKAPRFGSATFVL